MIAAIYARKSTDQRDRNEEDKSVPIQIERARQYAEEKGWVVAEDHIYSDDGISGAEFATRPGFVRLMNSLKPRPPFQVLILAIEERLGREQIEVSYALKQLIAAGVRVFTYLDRKERTLNTPLEKGMLALQTMADEIEREKARIRTYDAMQRKAKLGHVCGGRTFGYDNVCSACGQVISAGKARCCKDGHTKKRVNEPQADVVRRIFILCAQGEGYSRIAKLLNEDRALAPRPQQNRPSGWSPSSVNEVLHRPLYRGEVVWNRSRKRNDWGQQQQQARPAAEWLRLDAPDLRIVSEEQWHAAQTRLTGIRRRLEQLTGRSVDGKSGPRRRGNDSNYLLSGFGRCTCGGGIGVTSRSHGRERAYFYACTAYHKRGPAICDNSLAKRIEIVNDAVLNHLVGEVLRPAVIQAEVDAVLDALNPRTAAQDIEGYRKELRSLDQELVRLGEAIMTGGHSPTLLALLKAREQRREEVAAMMAARRSVAVTFSRRVIEGKVRERLKAWRERLLGGHVPETRQWLREHLIGPLKFTRKGNAYQFEGELAIGALLVGVTGLPTVVASPTGFEPVFWP